MTRCYFCQKEVNPDGRSVFRAIAGWEAKRSRGGANRIALRVEMGEYAHKSCVELEISKQRYRVLPGQLSLMEDL